MSVFQVIWVNLLTPIYRPQLINPNLLTPIYRPQLILPPLICLQGPNYYVIAPFYLNHIHDYTMMWVYNFSQQNISQAGLYSSYHTTQIIYFFSFCPHWNTSITWVVVYFYPFHGLSQWANIRNNSTHPKKLLQLI